MCCECKVQKFEMDRVLARCCTVTTQMFVVLGVQCSFITITVLGYIAYVNTGVETQSAGEGGRTPGRGYPLTNIYGKVRRFL